MPSAIGQVPAPRLDCGELLEVTPERFFLGAESRSGTEMRQFDGVAPNSATRTVPAKKSRILEFDLVYPFNDRIDATRNAVARLGNGAKTYGDETIRFFRRIDGIDCRVLAKVREMLVENDRIAALRGGSDGPVSMRAHSRSIHVLLALVHGLRVPQQFIRTILTAHAAQRVR